MDILERLNRRFGSWYDGLFGGLESPDAELRPKDILRRILAAMEDGRREGLDNAIYVPNAYTLRIAVASPAERDYLKSFLSAEELATAVARTISQHGYKTRGDLSFVIEEANAADPSQSRVQVLCRFDAGIANVAPVAPPPIAPVVVERPVTTFSSLASPDTGDEPGTVPAAFGAGGAAVLATLLVRSGDGRSLEAVPLGMRGVAIGRCRQSGNDIVLGDTQVSKRHGRIGWEGGAFVYTDENSTNGSRLNDAPVTPDRAYPLDFGDVLRLGESTLTLRPAGNAAPVSPAPVAAPGFGASLVSSSNTAYRLASDIVAGRTATADMVLTGFGVSDKHARLRVDAAGVATVEDLNTPGGTFVNKSRIPAHLPVAPRDNDRLQFGTGSAYTVRIG